MSLVDFISAGLLSIGLFFFTAGTAGMLRFPDTLSRLHAITKADNVGLGFVALALCFQVENLWQAAKLVLIWGFVLMNSAASCYLIASYLGKSRVEDDIN